MRRELVVMIVKTSLVLRSLEIEKEMELVEELEMFRMEVEESSL